MFRQFLKFIVLPVFLVALVATSALTFGLIQPVTAAAPDLPRSTIPPQVAQSAGITLEKSASMELVGLGLPVSYTLTIINDSGRATDFTLVDELPNDLALQTASLTMTMGTPEATGNTVTWSGTLDDGETATLTYDAIPPSTSSSDQVIDNVAVLTVGETTLEAGASITTQPPDVGLWGRFINTIAFILVATDRTLDNFGVPYAFGFSIILFTLAVRLATFPLNMQQIKSSKAMQELQPKMKELQEKYKNDREKLAQEQMAMYKEHGVNPLGGCLPMLVQMPIWFGLYQALIQLSTEGLLNQGFFWLPSLAGPVASNTIDGFPPSWIYPFIDGVPPLGWANTIAYLILPVLLIVSQVYMQQMMTPPTTDPQQQSMQSIMKFMPFMFGYFALIVPSGLTLYWFTSNILALVQQYFTKTQMQTDEPKNKQKAVISTSIPDNTPLPASTSVNSSSAVSGESRISKNAKKRKRRKRK